MEPISILVSALVAGASPAVKDIANQAIKDTYQGLRALVIQHWKSCDDSPDNKIEAEMFLNNLERDPEGFKNPLERKLNEIMFEPDTALIEQAQQLEKLLKEAGFISGKYNVKMGDNSQGVQIGNGNIQTNTFK